MDRASIKARTLCIYAVNTDCLKDDFQFKLSNGSHEVLSQIDAFFMTQSLPIHRAHDVLPLLHEVQLASKGPDPIVIKKMKYTC